MDNKYSLIETSDCVVCASHSHDRSKSLRKNVWCPWNQLRQISIQLMPALKVNIIIVHPRGVVFPRALAWWKTTSQGWTIIMFTWSAGINCFIILKFYFFFFCITLISFDKCEHFCKWTARMVPLGTPAVAILYILTSRTRFKSWSFYRYRKHFSDLDHCSPGHRWNRENKEFRIY